MARDLAVTGSRSVEALDAEVDRIAKLSRRPATLHAYEMAFQRFTDFLAPRDVWKAQARDVARWCVHLFKNQGLTPRAIQAYVVGINFHYERLGKGHAVGHTGVATRRSPARGEVVKLTYRGIKRDYGRPQKHVAPLLLDSIEKMVDWQPDDLRGKRDRFMILLGWAAALRESELMGLDLTPGGDGDGWLEVLDDGIIVHLRRSKMNQDYEFIERYAVPARPTAPRYCPLKLLARWKEAAGIEEGPVFRRVRGNKNLKVQTHRLECTRPYYIIRRAARGIGLDTSNIGSHSLRSGCITWLLLEGVTPWQAMNQSGHRNVRSVLHYYRAAASPQNSPLAQTRWVR